MMLRKLFSIWGGKSKSTDQLKDHNPLEDVQNLYETLNIDPAAYRRFETPPLPLHVTSDPAVGLEQVSESPQDPVDGGSGADVPVLDSAADAPAVVQESPSSTEGLSSIPNQEEEVVSASKPALEAPQFSLLSKFAFDTLHADSESAPVIGFASFSGGVGKSTLTAAMATALLARKQRCLVLAETEYSPLPYYMGWSKQEPSESPTAIRHINRPIGPTNEVLNLFIGGAQVTDLVEEAKSKVARADLMLLDLEASQGFGKDIAVMDMLIIPIRPDVNALIIIERIDQTLAGLGEQPKLGVFFVLNQYDDGKILHREIMQTLKQRLKSRLLDIVIPWDDTVQLALASGKPPQKLDTNSPFAQATNKLSAWLESSASLPSRV